MRGLVQSPWMSGQAERRSPGLGSVMTAPVSVPVRWSLPLHPNATSKIRVADDLHSCFTLGFRGEALASIAAIAYVTLITRHREEEAGTRLIISGGEILEQGEIGAPVGTTLTVEEIFLQYPGTA